MSCFATLPDLCLLALFRQLPLTDQMDARAVCSRWSALIPVATRTSTRSLNILIVDDTLEEDAVKNLSYSLTRRWTGDASLKHLKNPDGSPAFPFIQFTAWNCLHYRELNLSTANRLVATFPGISKLHFAIVFYSGETASSQFDSFCHLLTGWGHQLVTLKFYDNTDWYTPFEHPRIERQPIADQLGPVLNSLPALRCLNLDSSFLPAMDLSKLFSQLDRLLFSSTNTSTRQFASMLRQRQDNCRIEYSSHDYNIFDNSPLDDLAPLGPCFNRLYFYIHLSIDLHDIGTHFRHLTSLCIRCLGESPAPTLRALFTSLHQLTQLVHLDLNLPLDALLPVDQAHLPLPQIPSLRAFDLEPFNLTSHLELGQLQLPWTMPNLEALYLYYNNSDECKLCNVHYKRSDGRRAQERRKQCLRLINDSLQSTTKLQVIKHLRLSFNFPEEILVE